MDSSKCLEIKDLEERLICLRQKYQELTDQIAQEREGLSSDDSGNTHYIATERIFVQKQIQITLNRLKNRARGMLEESKIADKVVLPGTRVKLKNHTHDLEVCIVGQGNAEPENGYISESSPLAKAALGKKLGDKITVDVPRGAIPYEITDIKPIL